MARHKNTVWDVAQLPSTGEAQLTVLMGIRDELQTLNRIFNCPNFLQIPRTLQSIRTKLPTKRRRKKK